MGAQDTREQAETARAGEGVLDDEIGLERLIFFSDAVIAIAITLLVLEIHLPALPQGIPVTSAKMDEALLQALQSASKEFLSYFLSFAVIGLIWMGHHRTFRYIGRYDNILILLNLLELMLIAFIPFPTALVGDYYGNRITLLFYASMLSLVGLSSALLWWYVTRDMSLLHDGVNLQKARARRMAFLPLPLLFVAAAIIAIWSPEIAWLLMWGILIYSIVREVLIHVSRPNAAKVGQASRSPQDN